tara:strand:- start:12291 stop:12641 length:351 start_codon:yes stop_codon:yes gene_type:complete
MSSFSEVEKAWQGLDERIRKIFKNKKKRFYTLGKNQIEQRINLFVDRETQEVLLKISIDVRYKVVLENDKKMVDIFSQDATIAELVKQTDSFKQLEECLLAYREAERGNAVYNRLS